MFSLQTLQRLFKTDIYCDLSEKDMVLDQQMSRLDQPVIPLLLELKVLAGLCLSVAQLGLSDHGL